MRNEHDSPSKIDKVLKYLEATSKVVRIIITVIITAVLIYVGIKLIPLLSQNKTNIVVENANYSAAMTNWGNGNYIEAENSFLASLEESKKQYGENDLITAQVHQKLGALYNEMARYDEAIEQLNQAYVTFSKKLGYEDGMTIITKAQIGIADIHLGNYEQGFRGLNDAYDYCTSIDYKIQIAQGIAQCHMETGDYAKAKQWNELLEDLYAQFYGDSIKGYSVLLTFWNDRAILYDEMGDASSSIEGFETARTYWMKAHNVTDLSDAILSAYGDGELANILINEAMTIVESNREISVSKDCVDKALIICRNRFAENDAETARCYSAISGVFGAMSDKDNEKKYLDMALEISLNTVGENSELSSSIYSSLGHYYRHGNEYEIAITYYERALEIRRNLLKYNDLLTAELYESILIAYNSLLEYEKAIEAGRKAVEICEELVGEENMHTAEAYSELSRPLINTNQYGEAQVLLDKTFGICKKNAPNGSITEAFAYRYQMKLHFRLNKYDEALETAKVSLELFEKIQGESHSNTAEAKCSLGDVYAYLGDALNANKYYAQAVNVYNKIFASEIVHEAMDSRIKELIALESIDTKGMSYQEIEDKISKLAETITNEQVKKRYSSWGIEF